jgi:hypothetical protein
VRWRADRTSGRAATRERGQAPAVKPLDGALRRPKILGVEQQGVDHRDQAGRDLVLGGQDFAEMPVEPARDDRLPRLGVDDLAGHAQPLAGQPGAAGEQVLHAARAGQVLQFRPYRRAFRHVPRHHDRPLHPRQRRGDVLGKGLAGIVVRRVAAGRTARAAFVGAVPAGFPASGRAAGKAKRQPRRGRVSIRRFPPGLRSSTRRNDAIRAVRLLFSTNRPFHAAPINASFVARCPWRAASMCNTMTARWLSPSGSDCLSRTRTAGSRRNGPIVQVAGCIVRQARWRIPNFFGNAF